jgi:hypothetical protein
MYIKFCKQLKSDNFFSYAVVADEQHVYTIKFQFENACNFLTSQVTYPVEKKNREIFKNLFYK